MPCWIGGNPPRQDLSKSYTGYAFRQEAQLTPGVPSHDSNCTKKSVDLTNVRARGRLASCKVLPWNRTKMFHVKHFYNNSKFGIVPWLVGFARSFSGCLSHPPIMRETLIGNRASPIEGERALIGLNCLGATTARCQYSCWDFLRPQRKIEVGLLAIPRSSRRQGAHGPYIFSRFFIKTMGCRADESNNPRWHRGLDF